ncbi:MAG: DUF1566 domain-containing protein [Polyangiales bacterium]
MTLDTHHRRLGLAQLVALLLGAGCALKTAPIDPPRPTVLDEIGQHVSSANRWFSMVADLSFSRATDGTLEPDFSSLHSALVLRQDGAGATLRPRMPARANEAHTLALATDPSVWVTTREYAATSARAEVVRGVVVYAGAVAGGDLLYKLTPTHVDEYLYLRRPPARLVRRARIERGPGVASLRQTSSILEVIDRGGDARLRLTPPLARASDGKRRRGTVRLEGDDIVMEIDLQGLAAPVLVDPDWSTTGTMTVGHWQDSAWRMRDGRVMVVAGCSLSGCPASFAQSACGQVLADTETWSEATGTWTAGRPLATARYAFGGAALDGGDYLVAGGCLTVGCTQTTDAAERYQQSANAWVAAGALTARRSNLAMVTLADGSALAIGGCDTGPCSTAVDRFDPATNTWTARAPLPSPRGHATATVLADGRVLVAGGCADTTCATILGSAVLYDPAANTWRSAGTLADARSGHSATALPSGGVLIAGGCGDAMCLRTLPTTELWSAEATSGGVFRAGATMPGARHDHTATTLATGEILFAGGANGAASSLPTAQVYLPAEDRWAAVEAMHLDRAYHVAMLLDSRNVLLAGGCNTQTCMPWAEVFSPANLPQETSLDGGRDATVEDVGPAPDVWVTAPSPHPAAYRAGARKCQTNTAQGFDCPLRAYPFQDPDFQPSDFNLTAGATEVTDNVSGLVWQKAVTNAEVDQAGAVAYCAAYATPSALAGRWRLPSVVELATIVDYGRNLPSIDPRFVDTLPANYWTSTPVASGPSQTWTVKFDFGEVVQFGNAHTALVRCVHGHMPNADAGVAGRLRQAGALVADGLTVRDESTGLEWQREDDGVRRSWQDGLLYCARLDLAGKTGWHMPNVGELRGLVEYGGTARGAVLDPVFTRAHADLYWTSTPNDGIPTLASSISFNLGVIDGVTVTGLAYVRCVRHLEARPAAPETPANCGCRAVRATGRRDALGALAAGLALIARSRTRRRRGRV